MNTLKAERLARQFAFLVEADRLRTVLRRTRLISADRLENSAEHSWYLTLMVLTLAEYAAEPMDVLRVLKMLVVHDLVEIDAGDTFAYDVAAQSTKAERERLAADRIFGLLPDEQAVEMRRLWNEFEEGHTPEAKFAAAMDFLGGMLPNYHNQGGTWREYAITRAQVVRRNCPIGDGVPVVWEYVSHWIDEAVARGWVLPEPEGSQKP